jgi:predicted hotdog family 3-hydroxylacyl-ACP dehydratase
MKTDLSLPMSVEKLIPHRAHICQITRLLEYEDKSGVVESIVAADNLALDDGMVLNQLIMIEMMAQAYAAIKGYDNLLKGMPVTMGFLVNVRNVRFFGICRGGDRLKIKLKTVASIGGFAVADGKITCNGKTIVSGTIKLWVPDKNDI